MAECHLGGRRHARLQISVPQRTCLQIILCRNIMALVNGRSHGADKKRASSGIFSICNSICINSGVCVTGGFDYNN